VITAPTKPKDPAPGRPQRFSVSAGTLARRIDAWSEILAGTVVPFDVRPSDNADGGFRGVVEQRRFGDLALIDCAFSPCVARRGQDLVDGGSNGERRSLLGIQLMQSGIEVTRDRRRGRATISPGQVVLWDSRRTVEVEALQPVRKRVLVLPQEVALSFCPRLAEQTALPPIDRTAAGRLLVRYINSLALELTSLDSAAQAAASNATIELLRAAIEPVLPDSRDAIRAAMREDIRHHVRMRLQDPGLGPASIAQAYSMSVRALHGLFEEVDESVAGLVRSERLERCMQDLRQPSGGSVTTIAFRWGFSDTAHFSRVFKRTFGTTPSAVRRAALEKDDPQES
jgi:AraC family transcriptional regulator, positive regulator of tynA and feaB